MAKLTFTQLKAQVALRLGNMQSSDPFYSYLGQWVNDAGNRVILRTMSKSPNKHLNLFPELYDKWEDITVADQAYLLIPSDVLFVVDMFSFDKTGTIDWNTDGRIQVTELNDVRQWELLPWSTTTTGYPRRWMRYGNRIQLHPCPRTGYTTKTGMLAFAREADLSGASDTFVMDGLWNPAVVSYATYTGASWLGWNDEADKALEMCDRQLEEALSIVGRERAWDYNPQSDVMGDPTNKS